MRPEDEAEFAGLVERQWRFACRVAWAVLRQAQDAEDAAQEAFLKIWRAQGWRDLRDERAYVARIAWRAAVDRLRDSPSRRTPLRGPGGHDFDPEELADRARGPEEVAMASNWEAAVHRLIDSLPEELRQPLALSAEMTSREIAATMGIAEGTVRTRLMRARQILREKITAMEERRYAGQ
ncbi:MAG: sigma-70 family RNA polymerase sigma factor [Acidobacteriaceae bacterium]